MNRQFKISQNIFSGHGVAGGGELKIIMELVGVEVYG